MWAWSQSSDCISASIALHIKQQLQQHYLHFFTHLSFKIPSKSHCSKGAVNIFFLLCKVQSDRGFDRVVDRYQWLNNYLAEYSEFWLSKLTLWPVHFGIKKPPHAGHFQLLDNGATLRYKWSVGVVKHFTNKVKKLYFQTEKVNDKAVLSCQYFAWGSIITRTF